MKDVIRSNGIEIKKIISQQIVLRSSGNSEFNGVVNKALKLLPPSDNLRIVTNDNFILAKMSFDQWNLIFKKDIEQKKFHKLCNTFNKSSSILATNLTDSQIFFQVGGENATMILNKLTHFDFREKSFKPLTAAQTLLARIDCSIFNLDNVILLICGRSFSDYLEDRLIDAVNL